MSAAGIRAGRAFVEIGANSAPLDAALLRLRAKLQSFGAGLAAVGGGLMAASGGVLGALAWPLQLAANLETTQAAFETMLKDATAAKTLLAEVNRFGAETPFEFPELADATKKLLAFGSSSGTVVAELRRIGDISSGIGAPIGEIAELYGKARVQGRLFAQDINQLTGRGIPIIQELAKQFGVADSEVKKLIESGKIGFPELERAFVDMTSGSGQFAGGMDRQSRTLLGLFSTLKDSIGNAVRPIGSALLPVMAKLTGHLSTAVGVLGVFIEKNADLALYVAGGAAVVGALGAALVGIGGSIALAGFMITGIGTAAVTVWGPFAATLGVIGAGLALLATPLGALTVGAFAVANAFGGWRELLAAIGAAAGSLFGYMAEATSGLGAYFGTAFQAIQSTWAGVVSAITGGTSNLATGATQVGSVFGSWGGILGRVQAAASSLFGSLGETIANLQADFGAAFDSIQSTWAGVVAAIAAGNLQGAMEVAAAGLNLAWVQVIQSMQQAWDDWTGGFRDSWTDAITYLSQLGISGFVGILTIWENVTTGMAQAFDTVAMHVIGMLDLFVTNIKMIGALWQALWSDEGQAKAEADIAKLGEEFKQRTGERMQSSATANAARGAERDARVEGLKNQAAELFNEIAAGGEREKQSRRATNQETLAAQQRLREAQERFAATGAEADKKNAEEIAKREAKAGELAKAAGAAKESSSVAGTFNASLAGQQAGLQSQQREIAKATKDTAKGVQTLVTIADQGSLVFG